MSINTEDREVLRRKHETHIRRLSAHQYEWWCPQCNFHRRWETESGAVNGAAGHLLTRHNTRLVLSSRATHDDQLQHRAG